MFAHKKIYYLLLGIILIIVTFFHITPNEKKNITRYINKNHIDLQFYSENLRKNTMNKTDCYDKWKVTYWSNNGIVEFTPRYNNSFQSVYKGFYYSHDNIPLGFQGNIIQFNKHKSGWMWTDNHENSDNWEYTEKIIDCWYWFEMHF